MLAVALVQQHAIRPRNGVAQAELGYEISHFDDTDIGLRARQSGRTNRGVANAVPDAWSTNRDRRQDDEDGVGTVGGVDAEDWAYDDVFETTIPEVLTLGEQNPDYDAHLVAFSLEYEF